MADPGLGGEGSGIRIRALPVNPISFIFMQFSAKCLPNNRLALFPLGLAPSGNPGSATAKVLQLLATKFAVYGTESLSGNNLPVAL